MASPVQSVATTGDQPCVEVLTAYDVAVVTATPDLGIYTFSQPLGLPHAVNILDVPPAPAVADVYSHPLTVYKGPRVNYAGFGAFAQDMEEPEIDAGQTGQEITESTFSLWEFIKSNGAELLFALLAFLKVVVRLTPTIKDDAIFGKLDSLIAWIVPNYGKKA